MTCATREMCKNPSCKDLLNIMPVSSYSYDNYDDNDYSNDDNSDYDPRLVLFKLK